MVTTESQNQECILGWKTPVILLNSEKSVIYMNNAAMNWSEQAADGKDPSADARKFIAEWLRPEICSFSADVVQVRSYEKKHPFWPEADWIKLQFQRLFKTGGEPSGTLVVFGDSPDGNKTPGEPSLTDLSGSVLDSLNDPIAIIDAETKVIIGVNQIFLGTAEGHAPEDILGRPFHQIICSHWGPCFPQEGYCPLMHTIATGEHCVSEHCRKATSGKIEYSEISAFPIKDPSGRVVRVVHVVKEITARKEAEQKIQRLAFYDPLTDLPNRALFMDRLNQALTQARRKNTMVGLLFLDLDNFKKINDNLGHEAGDRFLQITARRLKEGLRQSDTVARLGGDEFVVVLTSIRHDADAAFAARHLLANLSKPIRLGKRELYTTGSVGIALYPTDGEAIEVLLKNGDMAMYEAKERGRNNYQFYSHELNRKESERLKMESALTRAFQNSEFFLEFQPQVDLRTKKPMGMEALLRWGHPSMGRLSQSRFEALATETGLIFQLGEWALRSACIWSRSLQNKGFAHLKVSVNVSGAQFRQPNFVDIVDRVLEETALPPHLLELELSEQTIMENMQEAIEILTDLKVRGISLAVDNFGTGYSSLNSLKNFPIDRIKIAPTFIRKITVDADKAAIVRAIIAIAHSFGMYAVADGVESEEQMHFVEDLDCAEMQGTFFAPPMTSDECLEYLEKNLSTGRQCI